jgi:hypothetical protein
MASPVFSSNYNGDVLDYIIQESVLGLQAVEKGSVYAIENVSEKISIAKMVSSSNPIGSREAMPTTKTATVTWSEATLEPRDMMVYIPDINPRVFESAWREFQPKGALPDKVLDPQIQKVFADVVLKQVQAQLGRLIWQGSTALAASNPLSYFDGYITRAQASSTNIDVANIGAITAANVIAVLDDCNNLVPDALYEDPNMIFHMSTTTFRLYQEAVRLLTYKGTGPSDAQPAVYAGREIRHYSGFPANVVLVCKATTGTDSNLYLATDKVRDTENLVIAKLRPEGEHFFLKALFKMDTAFSIDSESVYYIGS